MGSLSSDLSGSSSFPIVDMLGSIEKRTNLGIEIHLVYDHKKEYMRLSDVIKSMGGLIKIPSLILSG